MKQKLYANTNKQPLEQHLFAVGYLSFHLCKQLTNNEILAKTLFYAGCLHDIGKLDSEFQKWVSKTTNNDSEDGVHINKGKFSFEKYPKHNEISILLYNLLNDVNYKNINVTNKEIIKHVIYWHHTKTYRKNELNDLTAIYQGIKSTSNVSDLYNNSLQLINSINDCIIKYDNNFLNIEGMLSQLDNDKLKNIIGGRENSFPNYKTYLESNENIEDYQINIENNATCNIARSIVITVDRLVSSLSAKELNNYITTKTLNELLNNIDLKNNELQIQVNNMLGNFEEKYPNSERNIYQHNVAKQLSDIEETSVLRGPAGCGKTKIALEWATMTDAKKIYWICPRVNICLGIFSDLTSNDYLPNSKIEIHTGEFKYIQQNGIKKETTNDNYLTGDIIILTIDQILNSIVSHKNITTLVDFMSSHIIFDEFHECINIPIINLLFSELIYCKKQSIQNKCLLVSATPNPYFVTNFLEIPSMYIVNMKSFNSSKYKIQINTFNEDNLDESNPLFKSIEIKNTFVISNTAKISQQSFINHQENENAILFHSKFKKLDKLKLFNKVTSAFKQNNNKEYDVLRSGPIVQASLNITCDYMISEYTNAENTLQRLGRLDRFGDNKEVNNFIIAVPDSIINGRRDSNCARFLNRLHLLNSSIEWFKYLTKQNINSEFNINDIYQIYDDFYNSDSGYNSIETDLLNALEESVRHINNKILEPFKLSNKKLSKTIKISNNSLRNNNRFIEAAIVNIISTDNYTFLNNYASSENDYMTLDVQTILGYDDSEKNLLAFMKKKHHNIKNNKKTYNDTILLNKAKSIEEPIYVSYTPEDLEKVNSQPHDYAIYYAIGIKQPIGLYYF